MAKNSETLFAACHSLLLAVLLLGSPAAAFATGTIRGQVWNDLNNNNLRDGGEPGLGSIWVQVETPAGAWTAGGYTNMSGGYSFDLAPGTYVVKIANPGNGFNGIQPNAGSNDAIDSDVSIYGFSDAIALANGQTVTVDGGFSTGGQCYTPVLATTGNIVCNGNSFTFQITATGGTAFGGQSWGWNYVAGGLSMQPYGQPVTVGPFPCGGPATVTLADVDNPFCTATVTVNSPSCCGGTGNLPVLTINDVTVNEPAGTATLQICASTTSGTPMTVQFSTSNGSAVNGSDYGTTSGTATIPAGQTCTTVTIPIVDDNVPEPTEVFNVNLNTPTGSTIGDPTGTVTITDNDQPGGPNCDNISITANGNNIVITGLTAPVIYVQIFNSAWASAFDQTYTNSPGTVTVPGLANGTYFVKVSLLNAGYNLICKKEAYVTTPGGNQPVLTINDVTVNENAGTATLRICASQASATPITVVYNTANGLAVAGSDYSSVSATATIPAGQTCVNVTFPILDDNVPEPTEAFNVNLNNPNGATIGDPTGTVTILDNDQQQPCNLNIGISNLQCDGKGTASTGDDTYTFNLTVTGTGTGATWSGGFSNAYLGVFQFGPTAYGTVIPMGPFPAGAFTPGNVFPPITLPNGVNIDISVSDSQNPNCSRSTTVNSPGPCSQPGGPNCDNINIAASGNNIVITGLTAPVMFVQAFNGVWAQVFNQNYISPNPPGGTVTIPGLASGTYFVKVDFLTANWTAICKKEVYITIGGNPPALSISDITVNENAGTASLTVSLSAPSPTPTTVTVTTSNGTAINGSDYTPTTVTVTIPAGLTSTTVTFPILDDNIPEPTELFNANLSNPSGATIADPLGTVTILDNDQVAPTLTINDVTVNENAGTATLQICASQTSGSPMTVQYTTSNSSAVAGSDYSPTSGTATIPAGQTCVNVTFPILDDNILEPTEVFNVTLTNPNNASIADPLGTVTILDNDSPIPTLTINDITVNENAGTASLQICASAPATSPINVQYSTSNGTALSGSDYSTVAATATIPVGQTCTTVTFPILDDNLQEPTELFNVVLTNPSGATIADPLGTVTILDNDAPTPVLTINDVTVNENAGTASLQICIASPSGSPVTVNYQTGNGSAFAGSDYTTTSGTATIPAGQTCTTVTFPIVDDNLLEPTELFNVTLTNPNNATIGDPLGTVTILDNDQNCTPTFSGCPQNITVTAACGQNTATATWTAPTATSVCGTPTVSSNFQPGASFPVGTTTVTYTAVFNGLTVTCQFTVRVNAAAFGAASEIAHYSFNNCAAGSGSSSYAEFTANTSTFGGFTAVSGSVFRNNGGNDHSCNDGQIGLAICTQGSSSCTGNSAVFSKALAFDLTIAATANTSQLTGLSFYQRSSNPAYFTGGNSTHNNILSKIAVRVKDASGAVLFEKYDVPTTVAYGLVNINFPSPLAVSSQKYTFELIGFCPSGNSSTNYIYDIDELRVFGNTCLASPAPCNKNVLFVVGNTTLNCGDAWIKARLLALGLNLNIVCGSCVTTANATGAALVVISSTVTANDVNTKFTNVAVPVLTWESFLLGDLKMTASEGTSDIGYTSGKCVNVPDPSNPMAVSGCTDNVDVFDVNCSTRWANPGSSAIKTGKICGSSNQWAVFGYETGSTMFGMNAPARRVGFFLDDCTAGNLTLCGRKMFDQAVRWAINCSTLPNVNATVQQQDLTFNAYRAGFDAKLKWVSTTGEQNDYFVVERSSDQNDWTPVMKVDGKGSADEILYFSEVDENPLAGENFYRLQLVFRDGSSTLSEVQKVIMPASEGFGLFPNPAGDLAWLNLAPFAGRSAKVVLTNQVGIEVSSLTLDKVGDEPVSLDLQDLPSGYYLVTIESEGLRRNVQLVVSKK